MSSENIVQSARPLSSGLWRKMILFSLGYFLCAEAGSYLSAQNGAFVSFWLPAGLFVAVLLLNSTRDWVWLTLAAFPAGFAFDYLYGTRPMVMLCFFCANTIQAVMSAWLVRRLVAERPSLSTLKEFTGLVILAGILSTMLGACIGAATLVHFGLSHSYVTSWKVWWGSNAMAILLLTTFILAWFPKPDEMKRRPVSAARVAEAFLLLLGLSGLVWYMLAGSGGVMTPNRALTVPFLLWAGLRFGARGATAASLFLALALSFFTAQYSLGLTATDISSGSYVFHLQTVLAMGTLVSLIPAIVLGERDRTTTKLRESEERFRNLTQAAFEGICISENGRILDVNDQALKMFGYERDDMIGRQIIELVAPEWRDSIAERIRAGKETIYGHQLLRKDGSTFSAEAKAKMVHIGSRVLRMTALRDITERKKAEEALRESEEKFSKAFRTSPDVMSITDFETGCYLEVNDAHEKIFGFKREEVIGRSPLELGILEKPTVREKMLAELKTRGSIRNVEIETRTRDGGQLALLHSAELIELGGRTCVLRVSHDITDRKRAELERAEALSREAQARAEYTLQLIASQEAERKRIAAELHDSLGQNLLLIKNLAQMALRETKTENISEHVTGINHLAAQCIAETRQISRDLHPHQLDHLGLKRALEAMLENTAQASEIKFVWKIDDSDELFSTDAAMNLYRIVQESLNNILKHSRADNAAVRLERDVHEVQLRVEDDGCGFQSGVPAENRSGLGLKNITERVRMLSGTLKIDSAPGKGTRVEVNIPVAAEAA